MTNLRILILAQVATYVAFFVILLVFLTTLQGEAAVEAVSNAEAWLSGSALINLGTYESYLGLGLLALLLAALALLYFDHPAGIYIFIATICATLLWDFTDGYLVSSPVERFFYFLSNALDGAILFCYFSRSDKAALPSKSK